MSGIPRSERRTGLLVPVAANRFPDHPPYEGGIDGPEPLTIAAIDEGGRADDVAELARLELARLLPFRFDVAGVSPFEEPGDGTWQESGTFGLG